MYKQPKDLKHFYFGRNRPKMHFLKKGQKIRVMRDTPPPPIRAMPEKKRYFSTDGFPCKTSSSRTQYFG